MLTVTLRIGTLIQQAHRAQRDGAKHATRHRQGEPRPAPGACPLLHVQGRGWPHAARSQLCLPASGPTRGHGTQGRPRPTPSQVWLSAPHFRASMWVLYFFPSAGHHYPNLGRLHPRKKSPRPGVFGTKPRTVLGTPGRSMTPLGVKYKSEVSSYSCKCRVSPQNVDTLNQLTAQVMFLPFPL